MHGVPRVFLPLVLAAGGVCVAVLAAMWRDAVLRQGRKPPLALLIFGVTILTSFLAVIGRTSGGGTSTASLSRWGASLVGAAVLACALAARVSFRSAPRPAAAHLLVLAIGGYAATLFLSAVLGGELLHSISLAKAASLLYLPCIFWMASDERLTREDLLGIARTTCLGVSYASLALAIVSPHRAYFDPRRFTLPGITERLAGVTPHPNVLGPIAALALLLSLGVAKRRLLHCSAALITLVLSESRETFLAAIGALIVYWLFATDAPARRLILAAPALASAAVGAVLTGAGGAAANKAAGLSNNASNLDGRTHIWHVILANWHLKPLLGWGPFAFSTKVLTPFSISGYDHAHNQWLEALAEGGLVGLAFLILLVIALVRLGWISRSEPIFPSVVFLSITYMLTEVPLSIQVYGLNFVISLAWMIVLVAVAATRPKAAPVEVTAPAVEREVARLGWQTT